MSALQDSSKLAEIWYVQPSSVIYMYCCVSAKKKWLLVIAFVCICSRLKPIAFSIF